MLAAERARRVHRPGGGVQERRRRAAVGSRSETGCEWIIHAGLGDDLIPFMGKESGAVNGAGTKMEAEPPEKNTETLGTPDPPGDAIQVGRGRRQANLISPSEGCQT